MKNIFLFLRWLCLDNYLPIRYLWWQIFHNLNNFFFETGVTLYNWKHREIISSYKTLPSTKEEMRTHCQTILTWFDSLPSTDAYYLEGFKIRITTLLHQSQKL